MKQLIEVTRALADPNRVRALAALKDRELCACQIVELLELAPSTVSKHMTVLRQAGLVEMRKQGRWIYYRRPGREAPREAAQLIAAVDRLLERDAERRLIERRLKRILAVDPEVLCRKQCRC
jgi:DNA-binding transcriptional ArsR family regulator